AGAVLPARTAVRSASAAADSEQTSGYGWLALASWVIAAVIQVIVIAWPPADWIQPPWANRLTIGLLGLWLLAIALATPGSIGASAQLLRRPIELLLGAPGRLGLVNSRRARGRVTATALAFMIGVSMIVGVSGFIDYWFEELFFRTMEESTASQTGIGISPVDLDAGMQAYADVKSMTLPADLRQRVQQVVGDRGVVAETYFALEPKLSFLGDSYFSFVLDPAGIEASDGLYFAFDDSSWVAAEPVMGAGCALLITPVVAVKNGAAIGDDIRLTGPGGPIECTVAAIGPTFVGASVISLPNAAPLGLSAPVISFVFPKPGADLPALRADMEAVADQTVGAWLIDLPQLERNQRSAAKSVLTAMQGMLLLAIAAAGLGALNTLLIGLQEREDELGLLRASGATSRQIGTMLVTEGFAFGLYGGVAGVIAGLGATVIFSLTLGGSPLGIADFPVRQAAANIILGSMRPALAGLVMAPLVTGAISFLYVRYWRTRLPSVSAQVRAER
ncbi:MAG: ABC transporter permease, partial [Anaerolineales bacterium]